MEREIHAKLTGAGGGGCVICFPKDPDFDSWKTEFFIEFEKKGYTVYSDIKTASKGVSLYIDE